MGWNGGGGGRGVIPQHTGQYYLFIYFILLIQIKKSMLSSFFGWGAGGCAVFLIQWRFKAILRGLHNLSTKKEYNTIVKSKIQIVPLLG